MQRALRAATLPLASTVLLGGTCQPPVVNSTATLSNTADVPDSHRLSLSYAPGAPGARVAAVEGAGLTFLQDVALEMGPAGITTDATYLQVFSHPAVYVDDTPPDPAIVRRGDTDYVDAHTGELLLLALDIPNTSSSTSRNVRNLSPRRASVSAWMARVEEDDQVLPWEVTPGSTGCHAIAPNDCFDVKSVTTALTSALGGALQGAFDPPPSGGADPDPRVRAGGVELVSYIPNVVPSFDRPGRRVRGVGFVFRADLQARAVADARLPTGGTPYHDVSVWLPVSLLFETDGQGGLMLTLDPFDLGGTALGQMASRVAVEVRNPGPGPLEAGVGAAIGDAALNGIRTTLSRPIPASALASGLMSAFFNMARGAGPLPADFDVVLIPERGAPHGSPVSPQLVPAASLPGVQLVFLQ